jgi:hypothetical protein
MKTLIVLVVALLSWTNSAMAADFGFQKNGLHSRVQQLDAQVQAIQLQQRAKLARQVQFLQQQQLVAANAVNVHAQLGQLRALQQAQALQALHLNDIYGQHQLIAPFIQPYVVKQHVVQQPVVVQEVVQQKIVVPQQVFGSQRIVRCRSCR